MPRADRIGRACFERARFIVPSFSNKIENNASSTITRKIALDHGAGRLLADAFGRAPHPQSVHAADDRDEKGEDRRLDQADEHVAAIDRLMHALQILQRRYIEQRLRNQRAAEQDP